jgi:anti-sigma factor RsiW
MTDTWTDRLSEYLDDELAPAERQALDAHLAGCAACTATLSELRRVAARAGSLAPRAPASDLWPGIASRTGDRAVQKLSASPRPARRISFTLPQLVAAGLALMVLSGGAVWIAQHGGRATSLPSLGATGATADADSAAVAALPDPRYDEVIADLERTYAAGRASLDPQTVSVFERNLEPVDRAIDASRRALAQDPSNIDLNNRLTRAKQQKLALLRQAAAMASAKRP